MYKFVSMLTLQKRMNFTLIHEVQTILRYIEYGSKLNMVHFDFLFI